MSEVNRQTELAPVGSRPGLPLPWMLLGLTIIGFSGMLYAARHQLQEERLRSAAALKASDETTAKLKEAAFEKQELENQLAELNRQIEQLSAQAEDSLKEAQAEQAHLRALAEELSARARSELNRRELKVTVVQNRVRVELAEKLLFEPGEVTLIGKGRDLLARLSGPLEKLTDRAVLITTHHDDGKLPDAFPSAWELTAARATAIARALTEAGIQDDRLIPSGRGTALPLGPNNSSANRARNRRVELWLVPLDTGRLNPAGAGTDEAAGITQPSAGASNKSADPTANGKRGAKR